MHVVHRLVGYDRKTDRMRVRFDIPAALLPEAKQIARVAEDDPDAAWPYPLSDEQTGELAALLGAKLDAGGAEFFLEAFVTG